MKTAIERRLYAYLLDRLMKSGTSYSRVSLADVGNRLVAADCVILEAVEGIDVWHDLRGLPSVTCLLRPYPKSVEEVVAADVFTTINKLLPGSTGTRLDACKEIEILNEATGRIFLHENEKLSGSDLGFAFLDFRLCYEEGVGQHNLFEHDLVNAYFFK